MHVCVCVCVCVCVFPGNTVVNNLLADSGDTGDVGSIPGSERSLKKEMATLSCTLAWEILWTQGI